MAYLQLGPISGILASNQSDGSKNEVLKNLKAHSEVIHDHEIR